MCNIPKHQPLFRSQEMQTGSPMLSDTPEAKIDEKTKAETSPLEILEAKWSKNIKHGPAKAIRLFCIECMGGQKRFVKDCESAHCALWHFRMGKDPRRSKSVSDARRRELSERMRSRRALKEKGE